MLYCLRCAAVAREEDAHTGCPSCGEGVFIKSKQHGLASRLNSASVSDKEALLDALEDAIGEETDRDCVVIVDADTIEKDEGAYRADILIRDEKETRTTTFEEEFTLAFLTNL